MMRRIGLLAPVVAAALIGLSPGLAHAYPFSRSAPTYGGDDYECTDCHLNSGGGTGCYSAGGGGTRWPCFNTFGERYYTLGWTAALQGADTDGDGANNSSELPGASFAGFHNRAAAVCSMEVCARDGSQLCSNNVVCTSSRSTFRGRGCASNADCPSNDCSGGRYLYNYFTFSFG